MTLHYHTDKQRKKIVAGRKRRATALGGSARTPTHKTAAQKETAKVDAFMRSRRAVGKKPVKPKPKTPVQIRQESATRAVGLGSLIDALQGKKKKRR